MITRVYRGAATAGLMRYLYGPGRHEEHKAAHMVACWDGSTVMLEPAGFDADRLSRGEVNAHATRLAKVLDVPLAACEGHDPAHVYHLVLRNPEQDRLLTDAEWAAVGEDAMHRTGIAPRGDAGGCRWVMVRHGDDHVHLVATLARQDGQRPRVFRDFLRLRETAAEWEKTLGLTRTGAADKTAAKAPTLGETHKAGRLAGEAPSVVESGVGPGARLVDEDEAATLGYTDDEQGLDEGPDPQLGNARSDGESRTVPRAARGNGSRSSGWSTQQTATGTRGWRAPWTTRERLARAVHTAAARSGGQEEFVEALSRAGVQVHFRLSERDQVTVTGASFSLAADPGGIRYGGGKLAPDLTWPKLQARWNATPTPTDTSTSGGAGEQAWTEAERIVREAAERLSVDEVDGWGWAAGDTARGLAWLLEGDEEGPVHDIADDLARAGREPGGRIDDLTSPARMLAAGARALSLSQGGGAAQVHAMVLALASLARAFAAVRRAQDRHAAAAAALRAEQRLMSLHVAPPPVFGAADSAVLTAPLPSPKQARPPRHSGPSWLKPSKTTPPGQRPGGPGGTTPPRNEPKRGR